MGIGMRVVANSKAAADGVIFPNCKAQGRDRQGCSLANAIETLADWAVDLDPIWCPTLNAPSK